MPVVSKPMKSLSSVPGVSSINLAILYSILDMSTSDARTLILFAGGCWAWRRLSNRIGMSLSHEKP